MKLISIVQAAVLLTAAAALSSATAEDLNLPSKLSGRWTTLDDQYTQVITASIDRTTAKGHLTVWSQISRCTIREAPMTVEAIADKIVMTVDPSWSNLCRKNVVVELTKVADSHEYVGVLRQEGGMDAKHAVLNVKMKP